MLSCNGVYDTAVTTALYTVLHYAYVHTSKYDSVPSKPGIRNPSSNGEEQEWATFDCELNYCKIYALA